MRALVITAALLGAAFVLSGCPRQRPQPVPGPQSSAAPQHTALYGCARPSRATGQG